MNILAIGDVVGTRAIEYLEEQLWRVRRDMNVSFVVVNGENATDIHGVSAADAKRLYEAGADLVTLGNHTFGRKDIAPLLNDERWIIRPANYPPMAPGSGYTVLEADGRRLLCINVLGNALMEPMACPFATVERILDREKGNYELALLDIHAEATSEKIALARYFDGRIAVMFGTHTHVQTADEQLLPKGSGYMTDLGMTGPTDGVIGTDAVCVIEKFRTKMPVRFRVAEGTVAACGALFTVDDTTGKVSTVKRIRF